MRSLTKLPLGTHLVLLLRGVLIVFHFVVLLLVVAVAAPDVRETGYGKKNELDHNDQSQLASERTFCRGVERVVRVWGETCNDAHCLLQGLCVA